MDKANIYLSAAEIIEDGEDHACIAIGRAAGQNIGYIRDTEEMRAFALFKPYECITGAWGWYWGEIDRTYSEVLAKECRILALCFAAAMTETGDL